MDYDDGLARGRQRRKSAKSMGDYVEGDDDEEYVGEEEEDDDRGKKAPYARVGVAKRGGSSSARGPARGVKTCPSCDEPRQPASTKCDVCDYVFTSATRNKDEVAATERFSFEPEREDDGSLKIEMILGRRRLTEKQPAAGHKLPSPSAVSSQEKKKMLHHHRPVIASTPAREKYCYEYFVKYKGMSYLKCNWLTCHQIEALGLRSKQALNRWLKKKAKGETEEIEDAAFDNSHCVVEKILDCKEVEMEVSDDEDDGEEEEEAGQEEPGAEAAAMHVDSLEPGQLSRTRGQGLTPGKIETNEPAPPNPRHVNPFVEGVPSGRVWAPMVRCRYLFNRLLEDEFADWFYEPVDTSIYHDYLDFVQRPMCFRFIAEELAKPNAYRDDPRLFAADVRLIWHNCEEYNGPNPAQAVFQAGQMFSRMFERYFQAWVLAFEFQGMAWEDLAARPWEYKCIGCSKDDDEAHLLMCDNCDAEFHTYCLKPSLPDIPLGPWWCPRCVHLDLEAKGNTHSQLSEDALREKVHKALKERKQITTKVYLVKWKDLGYSACTWERPEDLKDDKLIEEYHKINDAPPPEAIVSQEELIQQLSKRPYTFAPSAKEGDELTELEFQMYAQIRAMHFLRFNTIPPTALLKDCGSLAYAFALLGGDPPKLPPQNLRTEVGLVMAELVDHVAKGTLPPPPGGPQRADEYDVTFYRMPKESLSLNIGNFKERVVIMGFRERADGTKAPLDRAQRVKENDVLVAINGEQIVTLPFNEVIKKLSEVEHYMTLRFVASASRDRYLDGRPPPQPITRGFIKSMVLPVPMEDKASQGPSRDFSTAIYRSKENEWTARMWVNNDLLEIGKFDTKAKAIEVFKGNVVKHYGADALGKYCQGLDHFAAVPDHFSPVGGSNGSNLLAGEDSDYSDDEDGEEEKQPKKPLSNLEELQLWNSLGPTGRLVRAIKDTTHPPERSKWSGQLYWTDQPPAATKSSSGPGGKNVRWVEQLDANSGTSVRLFESISQASRVTQVPAHLIQQAVSGTSLQDQAGGFRWRYADESVVATQKALWSQQRGHLFADGEEEPWKKKLPTENKVYKDGNKLRDYQLVGVQWLLKCWYQRRSCILADEMGLGKTVQIVTMLEHIYSVDNLPGPFLVVVPLSTIEHWRRELQGWTDMRYCMYYDVGGQRGMRDVMREYEWYYKNRSRRMLKIHVLVTTYEALIKDYEEIAEIPWRTIVVDEAHRLRNWRGKLHECLKVVSQTGMQAYGYQHRVLMTGTPLQNNTQELWSLLHYIEPTKFPDLEKFNERYGRIETPEQVQALQRRLEPHLLRRTKEDVASDIPPKEETIIDVELTTLQKQYYRAIFERNHAFLYKQAGLRGVLPKLMNIQMELRKCCNHPFLVDGVEESELEKYEEEARGDPFELQRIRLERGLIASSGKMVLMDKLLPKLRREGHKVLIFSQMIKVLDLLEEFCERRGFPCERLDGRVTGNERQRNIDKFNSSPDSFVFLLSTRAGGVGINLTAADTVIIYDSDWNPQNDVQAQARCHRIGQTKEVQVYRLITRKSFEAEMFERANRKLGLEHAVLGGHNFKDEEDADPNKISNKEMEQLLRQGAYALLEEGNEDQSNAFCEDDIDKIMATRTHRIVMDGGGRSADWLTKKGGKVAKKVFQLGDGQRIEVDVNDPDFWSKVMPDLKTPETLDKRFQEVLDADDMDITKAYFSDLEGMTLRLIDLHRKNKCPPRDREGAITLLFKVTLREEPFTADMRHKAAMWRQELEGNRVRACRQDFGEASDEDGAGGRRRRRDRAQAPAVREDTHSDVCVLCGGGGTLLMCDGDCHRSFHLKCVKVEQVPRTEWKCPDCIEGRHRCLVCNQVGSVGTGEGDVQKCKKTSCGRFYHPECVEGDECTRVFKVQAKFLCPQHACRVCKKRPDPKPDKENFFLTCIRCPTATHLKCALGTRISVLTYRSIVCDRHADDMEREGKVVEPLTLESVAHIKYPARKQRQRVQTLAMLAGKGKGKKAKGAAAMLAGTGLDEGDYIMEADFDDDDFDDDDEEEVPDVSDDDGQVRKKKGKTTPKGGGGKGGRKSSTAGKIPVNRRPTILSYTSTLIGPFSGKGYKLEFLPLRPDGTPAPPPAYDDDEHDDDVYMEDPSAPFDPVIRIQFQKVVAPELDGPDDDDDVPLGGGGKKRSAARMKEEDLGSLGGLSDAMGGSNGKAGKKSHKKKPGRKGAMMSSDEGTLMAMEEVDDDDDEDDDTEEDDRGAMPQRAPKVGALKAEAGGAAGPQKLYCICRQPERVGDQYLQCDACKDWFHPGCMGLTAREFARIMQEKVSWTCTGCSNGRARGRKASKGRKGGDDDEYDDDDLMDDEDDDEIEEEDVSDYEDVGTGGGKRKAGGRAATPSDEGGAKKRQRADSKVGVVGKPSQDLYCICRKPEEEGAVYLGCDACSGWFHPECVGVADHENVGSWVCPECTAKGSI